mgnify:CR=1 FL=1
MYNIHMSDLEYQNEQTYFLTFCIEQYKHIKNMDGVSVKELFDKLGVSDYLIQNYEVLHTQSRQWLLDDIDAFVKNREAIQ